jgi:ABC-type sugar transport system ATPase subunit
VKRYAGDVLAVDALDLEIHSGELMVLVGPSGCGKSTTLRMIAGLETITDGTLSIGGRLMNEVHPRDRDIAMVFQSYALYPHMTVGENMAFGLVLRKTPRAEIDARVGEAARTLGLEGLLDRKPRALSGGQRQRVAMGRALVRQPQVFLFDEPLSNLDAKLRGQMRLEIARLHRQLGATMIYVTHDQVEAMTLADRIAILDEGRLQQLGTPMEVYGAPANRFVASFIGTPSMNFVDGKVSEVDGIARFQGGGVDHALSAGHRAAALAQTESSAVLTLGFRPTALDVAEGQGDLRGRVEHVERMGAETFAHVHIAGGEATIICRLPGDHQVAVGGDLALQIHSSQVHLFDGEGQRVVEHRSGGTP